MRRKTIGIVLIGLLIALLSGPLAAQGSRLSFTLFGGINQVFEYGSDDDYELGGNDFPVTPSHTPLNFGAALGFRLIGGLNLEADFRYHLGSEVTLDDPSDGDTIAIDTAKHTSMTANLVYYLGSGSARPFILIGAGIDTLIGVERQTLVSDYGYEIILEPPDDKTDLVFNGGGGLLLMFTRRLGVRLDIRYIHISRSGDLSAISGVNAVAGLTVRF